MVKTFMQALETEPRHLNMPGATPDTLKAAGLFGQQGTQPWDQPTPALLYKYFAPTLFHVLTSCLVRFSQRQVFEDIEEFKPVVRDLGTERDLRAFIELDPYAREWDEHQKEGLITALVQSEGLRQKNALLAQNNIRSIDEFGMLCFSERLTQRMWRSYADEGRGFALVFDTRRPDFPLWTNPGKLGKVSYTNEPIPSFLASYGPGTFFQKRTHYSEEYEWRVIRALRRTLQAANDPIGLPIYLAPFRPSCIHEVLITQQCTVEWEIRHLLAIDCRYPGIKVRVVR